MEAGSEATREMARVTAKETERNTAVEMEASPAVKVAEVAEETAVVSPKASAAVTLTAM